MEERRYTFSKAERLCSKKLIERLFSGGNKSFPAFPLRVVYMPLSADESEADVSILISVPKKRFKHAVDRNRVKRQVREAYRLNKHILLDALHAQETPPKMVLAFIWLDNKLHDSREVAQKVKKLLYHIAEDQQ
jgi:ribonuclease P protein component